MRTKIFINTTGIIRFSNIFLLHLSKTSVTQALSRLCVYIF